MPVSGCLDSIRAVTANGWQGNQQVAGHIRHALSTLSPVGRAAHHPAGQRINENLLSRHIVSSYGSNVDSRSYQSLISPETIRKIRTSVQKALETWDPASSDLVKQTCGFNEKHMQLAVFMDALYRHYFKDCLGRPLDLNAIPEDQELRAICKTVLNGVPLGASAREGEIRRLAAEIIKKNFRLQAKKTLDILYNRFDQLPRLQNIAPQNRWRLIIDPTMVEVLARHRY